jgi:signal transduction histidine kinase
VTLRWSRVVVEPLLAFVGGAAWFAISAVLVGELLPRSSLLLVAVAVLDVAVVLAVAHFWGIAYAVPVGMASVVALDWHYILPTHADLVPDGQNAVTLTLYLVAGVLLGELAVAARRRAVVSERARARLADEQAALRRVATLVARETPPAEVFAAVTHEVGRLLAVDIATMLRYESDGSATVVAAWSRTGRHIPVGSRIDLDGENVVGAVRRTRRPERIDDVGAFTGPLADRLREMGVQTSAGSPIVVDGGLWGVMVGASVSAGNPIAAGTELRIGEFTELAATAIANAETRAELRASRARLVAAGDQARQRIERDLHDGVQQRLVSLALDLTVAQEIAAADDDELRQQLTRVRAGLVEAVDDLRELSHGIHPAILTEGGLRPALSALARRAAIPVTVDVHGIERLPEPAEVGIYYVVSEAIANAIKHAEASAVEVDVTAGDDVVRLVVRDDGVGGAHAANGSGLVGLRDRIHALGGRLEVTSPRGEGTTIRASVPLETGD